MTSRYILSAAALAGILTLAAQPADAQKHKAQKAEQEKCYGIAKAGHNDCHAPGHACAGSGTIDADPAEYILLPKGLCEKIVGGSLAPGKPAAREKEASGAQGGKNAEAAE